MSDRITHVITGLELGGAETMLSRLIETTPHLDHSVVCLTRRGPGAAALDALEVPIVELGVRPGMPDPRAISRLTRRFEQRQPLAVQAWMYHANLFAGVSAKRAGVPNLWGIHHTDLTSADTKRSTRWAALVGGRLSSRLPDAVVCCAESARAIHVAHGYDPARTVVIQNGFDLTRFRPDPLARARIRAELGLPEGSLIAGHLGRFHPIKDHRTLIDAFARVAAVRSEANLVCAGEGVTWDNPELAGWIDDRGLRNRVRLLGRRDDSAALHAAFDIECLTSTAEAFSLVIGEAMACGTPCVVTDAGDSSTIVGETGRVVPPSDPAAFAAALAGALALPTEQRERLGIAARERVAGRWPLAAMGQRYEALWRFAATRHGRSRAATATSDLQEALAP